MSEHLSEFFWWLIRPITSEWHLRPMGDVCGPIQQTSPSLFSRINSLSFVPDPFRMTWFRKLCGTNWNVIKSGSGYAPESRAETVSTSKSQATFIKLRWTFLMSVSACPAPANSSGPIHRHLNITRMLTSRSDKPPPYTLYIVQGRWNNSL